MTGPSAGASVVGTVRIADARIRSAGGKTRNSMASPTGAIMPPPIPCSTLKMSSWVSDPASPHSADAPVNTAIASSSTRLPPNRSPSQADQEVDGDAGHGGGGDAEVAADRRQCHVHDSGVHDRHEHRRHVDDADGDLLADPGCHSADSRR